MSENVFSISKIKEIVKPIAEKYNVEEIYLFGSYARGETTKDSDLDFLVSKSINKAINDIFIISHLFSF